MSAANENLNLLRPRHYYIPRRKFTDGRARHPHPDTSILEKSLFWEVGGCDEDCSGYWAPGELYLHNLAHLKSARRVELHDVYLTLFERRDIVDANTTEFGRKGTRFHWKENPALTKKWKTIPYKPENPLRFDWERVI